MRADGTDRRPYPCKVEGADPSRCFASVEGVQGLDDLPRVCGQRCVADAVRDPNRTDAEQELIELVAAAEFTSDDARTLTERLGRTAARNG